MKKDECKLVTSEDVAVAVGIYNKLLDDLKIEKVELEGLMDRANESKKIIGALMEVHVKYTEYMEAELNKKENK